MSGVRRFLSVRDRDKSKERKPHHLGRHHDQHDKHDPSHQSHTESAHQKPPPDPSSAVDFYGLFHTTAKASGHSEEFKIKAIRQRIIDSKGVAIREGTVIWALRSKMTNGDDDAAYRFLLALSDASEGMITNYDSNVKMKGSVNREGVTCYLDSTLFSMFSRLDSFEAMLYNTFPDRNRNKLSLLLRLWVNLLRTGQLVTVDVTELIQNAIKECGWEAAAELKQHDASEAFTFITGKLELPLLTLKMDIYHTGKEDASDDHKFINERLLDVAIPEDPTGQRKEITLEDCLEEYFNNRVEVKRYLQRRSTLSSLKSPAEDKEKSSSVHVEVAEVDPDSSPATPTTSLPIPRPPNRHRSQSIIQERYIPARGESGYSANLTSTESQNSSRSRAGSVRKEVLMPAWQFFSLIPWYTDNAPSNDAQVAAHFSSKRPVLGLCLKRYAIRNGRLVRLNTYVDIPVEIGLPYFIQDDHITDQGPLTGNFKLSLQAVVCHRGNSVESGHYVALARGTTKNANENGYSREESSYWMRFDDLAHERITLIDIYKALREETPYLLFYQIVPVDGDPGGITSGEEGAQSQTSLPLSRSSTTGLPSSRPSLEITAATPIDGDYGREPTEGRRLSVISFTDGTKSGSSGDSPNPPRSRSGSIDLGRVSSKTSDGGIIGIGRKVSKLRRRSREPEPNPQIVQSESAAHEGRPDVQVRELSHSDSFASVLKPEPQVAPKPAPLEVRSAYQESRAQAQGHVSGDNRRNRSKNRLSKPPKGKERHHPDRECVVM